MITNFYAEHNCQFADMTLFCNTIQMSTKKLHVCYLILSKYISRVITTALFEKNDFVVHYAGQRITAAEAHIREKEYSHNPALGNYIYFFKHASKTSWL